MQHETPTLPVPLTTAITAWNENAQELAAPMVDHVAATLRAMQHLRVVLRHYGPVDSALFPRKQQSGDNDHATQLQSMCERVDTLAHEIARLDDHAQALSAQGEALMRDFLLLQNRAESASDLGDNTGVQLRLSADENAHDHHSYTGVLDQLIDAQKTEIDALSDQVAALEASLRTATTDTQTELPIPGGKVQLQDVAAYLQGSAISAIPANASYFGRILEAANAEEGHKVPMGRILTAAGVITERQLENALQHQKDGRRQSLGTLLVDLGYSNESAIAQALAAQLALPYVDLDREIVTTTAVDAVPAHIARRHTCFPISDNGHVLLVAMANPLDLIALEDLHIASGKHIRPCVATRGEIAQHIDAHYA